MSLPGIWASRFQLPAGPVESGQGYRGHCVDDVVSLELYFFDISGKHQCHCVSTPKFWRVTSKGRRRVLGSVCLGIYHTDHPNKGSKGACHYRFFSLV